MPSSMAFKQSIVHSCIQRPMHLLECKLCHENSSLSMPAAVTTSRKSSLALVYDSGTFFFFSVLCWWFLWLVIDLNMNSSEFSFIFAMLRYLCNVATGHNSEFALATYIQLPFLYISILLFSINIFIYDGWKSMSDLLIFDASL